MSTAVSSLDTQRQVGGKLILAVNWLMAVIVVGTRLLVHEPVWGLMIAAVAVAASATISRMRSMAWPGRSVTSVSNPPTALAHSSIGLTTPS